MWIVKTKIIGDLTNTQISGEKCGLCLAHKERIDVILS